MLILVEECRVTRLATKKSLLSKKNTDGLQSDPAGSTMEESQETDAELFLLMDPPFDSFEHLENNLTGGETVNILKRGASCQHARDKKLLTFLPRALPCIQKLDQYIPQRLTRFF